MLAFCAQLMRGVLADGGSVSKQEIRVTIFFGGINGGIFLF